MLLRTLLHSGFESNHYILDLARRTLRRIEPPDGKQVGQSVWLARGSKVGIFAFPGLSGEPPPTVTLSIVDPDGSAAKTVECPLGIALPAPDGESLLLRAIKGGWGRILELDLEGKVLRVIHEPAGDRGADAEILFLFSLFEPHMSWSRDGKKIAFAVPHTNHWDILTASPDGSGVRELVAGQEIDCYPRLSPDGTRLPFYSLPPNWREDPRFFRDGMCEFLSIIRSDGSARRRFEGFRKMLDQERRDLEECLKTCEDGVDAERMRQRLAELGERKG